MHKLHFVVDFSYQPSNQNPLKIFELGDAFTAGWVTKRIGTPKKYVGQYFFEDLKIQYPNALLLNAFHSGLNLTDLSNGAQLLTYDRDLLYNNSFDDHARSFPLMLRLIKDIIQSIQSRSENARLLLISICPSIAIQLGLDYDEIKTSSSLKIVNLFSTTLHRSLYDKKEFHTFASGSPIYPRTLFWDSDQDIEELNTFIKETDSKYYVVKPTGGTRSEGVHIISQEELFESISGIKSGKCFPDLYSSFHTTGILIQVCHLSKLIQFKRKYFYAKKESFYAKGRAIIRADFEDKDSMPVLNFLTGYWQLAHQPCEQGVNDKTAIAFGAANREGVVEIEQKDWLEIKKLFSEHLPAILHSMIRTPISPFRWERFLNQRVENPSSVIFKDFFKRQFIFPGRPIWSQKLYLGINLYWDDSSYRRLTKELIIDLTGINPSLKKYLNKDIQSVDKFIDSAILTRDGKKDNPLQLNHSCSYRFGSYILFIILIKLCITALYCKKPLILTISLLSLSCLLLKKYNDINKPDSFKNYFQDSSIMQNSAYPRFIYTKSIRPVTSNQQLDKLSP
jgi:hypothetical protein